LEALYLFAEKWTWRVRRIPNNTPQFDSSSGIAVDEVANIFVSDTGNDAIRQIISPSLPKNHPSWNVRGIISLGCVLVLFLGLAIVRRSLFLRKDAQPAVPMK
jgi:hypothetical protein